MPTTNTSTIGTGQDYTTIAAWEAATDNDLVTGDDVEIGALNVAGNYNESVTIAGATTDATRYRKLTVADGIWHEGTYSTSGIAYMLGDPSGRQLHIQEDNFWVERFLVSHAGQSAGNSDEAIRIEPGTANVLISRCILRGDTTNNDSDAIYLPGAASETISASVDNCLIYDWTRGGVLSQFFSGNHDNSTYTVNIDHCTFDNTAESGETAGGGVAVQATSSGQLSTVNYNIYNSVSTTTVGSDAYNDSGVDVTTNWAGSHNGCDDTSLTTVGITTGAQQSLVVADIYTDQSTDDYTPAATEALEDNGTNRQASEPDSRQDFSLDIGESSRGTTGVEIGCYAIASGGATGGSGSISTDSTVSATGTGIGTADGSASTDSTLDASGGSTAQADATATTDSDVSADGAAIVSADGSVSTDSTVDAEGSQVSGGDPDAATDSTVSATGTGIGAGDGSVDTDSTLDASGTGIASADAEATADTTGTADGAAVVTADGSISTDSTLDATGSDAASGASAGSGEITTDSDVSAAGTGIGTADASASSDSTVDASGAGVIGGDGSVTTLSTVEAGSATVLAAVGEVTTGSNVTVLSTVIGAGSGEVTTLTTVGGAGGSTASASASATTDSAVSAAGSDAGSPSMATTFNLTAREIITYALKKLRIVGQGNTPTAAQAQCGLDELNLMLKDWQKYRWLWLLTEGDFTPVADQANYTLDPAPYEVVSARLRQGSRDTPMIRLTRDDYFDLPLKSAQGTPTQFYFDRQVAGVLYIWPVLASVTSETIRITYRRKVNDVESLDDALDIRQEYLQLVGYNLAARLADDHAKVGGANDRVIARAEALLNEALDDDRDEFAGFEPEAA